MPEAPASKFTTAVCALRTPVSPTLADVLQNTLGKPVVDDTGISGTFNFELSWGDDLERTVAESQQSRLGIQLTADRRRLPTMIVDRADRGTALTIIARTGSVSSVLPVPLRQRLSRALSVH